MTRGRLSIEPPLDPESYAFRHDVRVRFAETDAMSVVHHGSYLLYLEEARVAWLRALGHPYAAMREEGIDFAVLEVFTRNRAPARFDDVITVHLGLGALTRATFQIGYLLEVAGSPVVTAVTVHGCMRTDGRPARMPAWVRELTDTSLYLGD